MTQKDIFGNETKFFEKASFFNGAEFTGNIVIDGNIEVNSGHLIMIGENGIKYKLSITNVGILTATPL
jgi:hypothetical protein